MLRIKVPKKDFFDNDTQTFFSSKECEIILEHSLVSLSKWESKWEKPFLGKEERTNEEMIDYIRCMTLTQNVDPVVYYAIASDEKIMQQINTYINSKQTATWFSEHQPSKPSREIVTSELIYFWMISHNIPMECQKWHLNRLLTLIRVCDIKNSPSKKKSKRDVLQENARINAARRKALGSSG